MPRRSGRGSEATSSSSSSSKKKVKSESPANADRNTIHSNKNDKNGNDESGSDEEEVEPPYNHLPVNIFDLKNKFKTTEREERDWLTLDDNLKTRLVKTAMRVLLMKGSRNESIVRATHVSAALGEIDRSYKKFTAAVLHQSQKQLYDTFGYVLFTENMLKGPAGDSTLSSKLMLMNALSSKKLKTILSSKIKVQYNAFKAFVWVVLQILWAAPGKSMAPETLCREIRIIDPRFPETSASLKSSSRSTNNAVPELADDLAGLLKRMKSEGYIVEIKTQAAPGDQATHLYQIGNRMLAELGRTALVKSYFLSKGEEPEDSILQEVKEEEENIEKRKLDELEEKEAVAKAKKNKKNPQQHFIDEDH